MNPPNRHRIVEQWLRPSCRCLSANLYGSHVVGCPNKNWKYPDETPSKPLKDPLKYLPTFEKLESDFLNSANPDYKALTVLALQFEALLKNFASVIMQLPGQPNSYDKYMLVDIKTMDEIYRMYKDGPPKKSKRKSHANNLS